eukprot:2012894-Rhodomonas_salina.4
MEVVILPFLTRSVDPAPCAALLWANVGWKGMCLLCMEPDTQVCVRACVHVCVCAAVREGEPPRR